MRWGLDDPEVSRGTVAVRPAGCGSRAKRGDAVNMEKSNAWSRVWEMVRGIPGGKVMTYA